MNHWNATEELRWVIRENFYGMAKILQQKWELWEHVEDYGFSVTKEEWRDVPTVEEE